MHSDRLAIHYATQYHLLDVQRVAYLGQRFPRVINRIFTEAEIRYCQKHSRAPFQYFAARLAAKFAVRRLLGGGRLGEIEIAHGDLGNPVVMLHGSAATAGAGKSLRLSLSHEGNIAAAFASVECHLEVSN